MLVKHGVSLCHTVQEPGQFILVFPRAFTSSVCTGYLVSESVYYAQPSWLNTAEQVFRVSIQLFCVMEMGAHTEISLSAFHNIPDQNMYVYVEVIFSAICGKFFCVFVCVCATWSDTLVKEGIGKQISWEDILT
jgi:hypothetical protein